MLKKMTDKFENNHNEIILLKDIPLLYSIEEYDLLPISCTAHIAYIPDQCKILSFKKIANIVDTMSKNPIPKKQLCIEVCDII